MIIDNTNDIFEISRKIIPFKQNPLYDVFKEDIIKKIAWDSNAIEGNTLSLEETIDLIDYDITKGKHKYSEYFDAKCLYNAICSYLDFYNNIDINENWIYSVNSSILGKKLKHEDSKDFYRKEEVGVGNEICIDYVAPNFEKVPVLMNDFMIKLNQFDKTSIDSILRNITILHFEFERIHPFKDGNGRTGRLILNQMLINFGLLPIYFQNNSEYRNSFKIYNNTKDYSKLLHLICKSELKSIDYFSKIIELSNKSNEEFDKKKVENIEKDEPEL